MRFFFLPLLAVVSVSPAFADTVWESCHDLAIERGVKPSEGRRHYERFMHACLAGDVVMPHAATAARGKPPRGSAELPRAYTSTRMQGWRCTVSGLNGQQYCF